MYWKRTWYFCWWRRGCLGHPQALTLVLLEYILGVTWASPSLSFCPFFISSHHSSLPTLENFLHTKLHTILISSISVIKIKDHFGSVSTQVKLIHKSIATFFQSFFFQKNSKKKRYRSNMQILAEICQNRTAGKDRFFRKSSVAQIEKCKTNES